MRLKFVYSLLLGLLVSGIPAFSQPVISSSPSSNKVTILSKTLQNGSSEAVVVQFPVETDVDSAKIYLNGQDVSTRFTGAQCGTGQCQSGVLVEADGLKKAKNVLTATAKKTAGNGVVSGRLRFAPESKLTGLQTQSAGNAITSSFAQTETVGGSGTLTGFLPPTVSFNTLEAGGWKGGTQDWIQIGTQKYPSAAPGGSCAILVMVFDRQTLEEKTSAPESSPQCVSGGTGLKSYLATLPAGDLVVLGTNYGVNADSNLDTTAIGGTDYTKAPYNGNTTLKTYPQGYMAIGAVGAANGSAYENYSSANGQSTNYYAYGMFTEDSFGNYSFQSSDAIEYIVSPNDPVYGASVVKTAIQAQFNNRYAGQNWLVYSPCGSTGCANTSIDNGYYLLIIGRDTLIPVTTGSNGSCNVVNTNPVAKNEVLYENCGTFFPTGSSSYGTATQAYQNLATALNAVTPGQLAFLTTVGTAAFADTANGQFQVAATANGTSYAYGQFAPALESLGGTPKTTLFLYQPNTAYTLVSSPGFGNSLTGDAVVSTNIDSAQGQTGYVHGTLERDNNGLYRPADAAQETPADAANNTGADYTLDKVTLQQPQEWPELSGSLTGGSSAAGMVSAYQYISYQLLTQYYLKGAQGAYLDDIHYYFTGGNNTSIDYHTFDPANLHYPGGTQGCYSWNDPVSGQTLPCFTANDFSAVANQVSVEVVDLVNVLQFMVNGSTNMKDIVAGGNASVALALTSAATTVYQSTLGPSTATTPVTLNLHKIFNLATKIESLAVAIASDGIIPPGTIGGGSGGGSGNGGGNNGQPSIFTAIKKTVTLVKDISKVASAASGPFYTGGHTPTPTTNYTFVATVSQLANSNLQGSMSIGFDTALDSILSDWGRLNAIGPQITNTNNPTFYSQNQVAQNASVNVLTQGAQRGFFLALLPVEYNVQFWPSTILGNTQPDMSSIHAHTFGTATCNPFYPYSASTSPWQQWAMEYPSYAGEDQPFQNDSSTNPTALDWFTIASPKATGSGSDSAQFQVIDSELSTVLFSPSQLNLPMDVFAVTTNGNGPLPVMTYNGQTSDPNLNYLTAVGYGAGSIGSAGNCAFLDGAIQGTQNLISTTTTYTGPTAAVVGQMTNLQATVAPASGTAVPTGSVIFTDRGVTLGTAPLDATGKATLSTSTLVLGLHTIIAYYSRQDPFDSSTSTAATLSINADAPDVQLTASASTLQVSYGATSSAINLQVASLSGMAGTVSFACSGLPIGMNCQFSPSQATLTDGSSATTSMTISSTNPKTAGLGAWKGLSALLLVLVLLSGLVIGRRARSVQMLCGLVLIALIGTVGCGGSDNSTKPLQETGTKTILVSATSGSITKSVPINVTIQ